MARPNGDGVRGRAPVGSRCYDVRFVDDDGVPGDVLERPQHFRSLHEIVRGDVDPGKRPGVHVRGPFRGHRSQPRGVGQECRQPEARGELGEPLTAQAGGCDDDGAARLVAVRELEQQQAGLNRLAQADAIRDEETRDAVAEHRERRFELIRQEANRCPRGGVERSERVQLEERAIELVEPAPRTDHAGPRFGVHRSGPIERRQQRQRAVASRFR